MSGIHVEVDSQTCYTFPLLDDNYTALLDLPEKIDMTCTPPLTGRVVRLQKRVRGFNREYLDHIINVCEVQVWGCRADLYGQTCNRQCGQCKDSAPCDALTGRCDVCQPNLLHPLCQECEGSRYGPSCDLQCSARCAGDGFCDRNTGQCQDGCQPGYVLSQSGLCTDKCEGSRYGPSCDLQCSAGCAGDGFCDRNTGQCQDGCQPGYVLSQSGLCTDKCQNGAFGPGCVKKCGNCAESRCNHRNGTCEVGCIDGHVGDMCLETSESSLNLVGPVAGAVFGGLCVIALSILVGLLIRRSRKRSSSETASPRQASNDQRLESGPSLELSGQAGLQEETGSACVTEAEESHIYDEIHTPDDSDRAVYLTPVFKGQQANAKNIHTYQNYFA